MKTISLSFFILLTISLLSCEKEDVHIVPTDQLSTLEHAIADFDELHISDPFQVYIRFSDTEQELRIEANSNLHSLIEVAQDNDELSIKLDDDLNFPAGTPVLRVFLTTNDIQRIQAAGAAEIYLENQWIENEIEVELTGACSLEGSIAAEQLKAEITGASNLNIQGTAQLFELEAEGASDMAGFDFETDKFTAELTGGCNASLTVHQELRVEASGASKVYYRGNGIVQFQDLSGGSEIIKE